MVARWMTLGAVNAGWQTGLHERRFNGPFRLLTRDVIFLGGPAAPSGQLA